MGVETAQLAYKARILSRTRRVVVKVGSSILSSADGMRSERMAHLARELTTLRSTGKEVVLVTSGAVSAGMSRLGMRERPRTIPAKQAAAAVGQIALMALYEEYFSVHGIRV